MGNLMHSSGERRWWPRQACKGNRNEVKWIPQGRWWNPLKYCQVNIERQGVLCLEGDPGQPLRDSWTSLELA